MSMRRLRSLFHRTGRFLLFAAALLSSLLLVLTVTFWIRSHFCSDYKTFRYAAVPFDRKLTLTTLIGEVYFDYDSTQFFYVDPNTGRPAELTPANFRDLVGPIPASRWIVRPPVSAHWDYGTAIPTFADRLGFHQRSSHSPRDRFFTAPDHDVYPPEIESYAASGVVPFWAPALLFAVLPALYALHFFRRRRPKLPGLCPACAYDLRMHQPGQKCPECGAPVAAKEGKAP